jgi:hypothetical protein
MKFLVSLAVLIYPREWRKRYGEEFAALLDDSGGGWNVLGDVLFGGLKMRTMKTDLRLCLGLGLAGLAIAAAMSFQMPKRFRSEATAQISGEGIQQADLSEMIMQLESHALSRTSLFNLIQDPALNLYSRERALMPVEDVIEQMKSKDLRIAIVSNPNPSSKVTFKVSYIGATPELANRTTQRIVGQLISLNLERGRAGEKPATLQVLDPASTPVNAIGPNRMLISLIGLAIGVGLGLLIAGIRRWPRVAMMGVAGAVLAAALSFAIPNRYVSEGVLRTRDADLAQQIVGRVLGNHDTVMEVIRTAGEGATLKDLSLTASSRDLRVRVVSKDRFAAQRAAQKVIASLIDASGSHQGETESERRIDVIDPPTMPVLPVSPNRLVIAGLGVIVGFMAGTAMLVIRRKQAILSLSS